MTPKEKAEELVDKCKIKIYNEVPPLQSDIFHLCILKSAKQCAIIAVNEIINMYIKFPKHPQSIYWKEVKAEIEKL